MKIDYLFKRKDFSMKKDYLSIIKKYTNHMTHDQLFDLFNLHSELFIKSNNIKIPNSYYNKPLNILTYPSYNLHHARD